MEEAKKFSRTASEEAKQSPEKVDPQSLNSIENGFGSKDNQQLVVSFKVSFNDEMIFVSFNVI